MSVLDGILEGVMEDLVHRANETPLAEVKARALAARPALDPVPSFRSPGVSIIAEVKRKSPSKGALADIPDPAALAAEYAKGGAAAISVLTEQRRFSGSLADLAVAREAVDIPLLRKDFIVTPYQLWEARAWGADLALLMVVSLPDGLLGDMLGLAREIGINARDLTTLSVDRSVFRKLVPGIPEGVVRVAESGVTGPTSVAEYHEWGADVVLVGDALVRSGDPRSAIAEFTGSPQPAI